MRYYCAGFDYFFYIVFLQVEKTRIRQYITQPCQNYKVIYNMNLKYCTYTRARSTIFP